MKEKYLESCAREGREPKLLKAKEILRKFWN